MSEILLEGQRALPKRLQDDTDFDFQYPELDQALADIIQNKK